MPAAATYPSERAGTVAKVKTSLVEHWQREHTWRIWRVVKEANRYVILHSLSGIAVPLAFRRVRDAQKYCETLDALADWTVAAAEDLIGDNAILARAYRQLSLDYSRRTLAKEYRDIAELMEQDER